MCETDNTNQGDDRTACEKPCGLSKMISGQGEMELTEFGALRESNKGRGRFDLIPYEALEALAKWYEGGTEKYAERNWEAGISVKDCINRMCRHAGKVASGWTDEDHLAAVMWNAAAAITMMQRKPECNDHTWWLSQTQLNKSNVYVGVDLANAEITDKNVDGGHNIQIPEFMKKKIHIGAVDLNCFQETDDQNNVLILRNKLDTLLSIKKSNGYLSWIEKTAMRDVCQRILHMYTACADKILFSSRVIELVKKELKELSNE